MTTPIVPTGPPGHLVRGHLPELMRDRTGFLLRCAREYGDLVPLRFGPRRALLVSDPDLIGEVLVARSATFVKPYVLRTDRVRFGDDRAGDEADVWRRQTLAQPAFHQRRMPAYGAAMVAATRRMLDGWQDGETRDVLDDMMRLTLEIAADTLLGTDLADEADGVADALRVVMDGFVPRLGALFLVPEWLPTPGNRRLRRASRHLDETMDAVIAKARPGAAARDDLLSLLLRAGDGHTGLTDRQVRQQATTFFLAGHETTALALTWAWCLLAHHPHAEAHLVAELDAALGGRSPTAADARRLPYAEGVVREAMRLYPPLWAMGRIARRETELGGHRVRAGTVVIVSQWVMHRDPRFFGDPERFDPARWTDGLAQRLPRYAYFPFGGGPRGCIGSRFALLEAVLLLATIAQAGRAAASAAASRSWKRSCSWRPSRRRSASPLRPATRSCRRPRSRCVRRTACGSQSGGVRRRPTPRETAPTQRTGARADSRPRAPRPPAGNRLKAGPAVIDTSSAGLRPT